MDMQANGAEQRFVASTFQKSFAAMKGQEFVLYGTGLNTQAVLAGTKGFRFAGLMDQAAEGRMVYGHKVLGDKEVIALHPAVVIIARQSVINIIYQRIQHLSKEHGISIYDIHGRLLGEESLKYQNSGLAYWGATEEGLADKIRQSDILSFDIFDTLLMRRVLQPPDVFELVQLRLKGEGHAYPFARMRQEAENACPCCPCLKEIYAAMQRLYGLGPDVLQRMQELECEVDAGVLLRREKMCQAFQQAVAEGRKVYLISDMYYPGAYLEKLLLRHGIQGYAGLFVSCDVKRSKQDGSLFQWYLANAGPGKKLHIGDNRRADIQQAQACGIETFQVYSAYEMLSASALQGMLAGAETLKKRCILGLVAARAFNDPFVLGPSRGRLPIRDASVIGHAFIGPLLTEFAVWLAQQAQELKLEKLLFPSRDGYLIQKLYETVTGKRDGGIYFRTSRRAASVAGITGMADIKRIGERKYHGTCGEFLRQRYGTDMKAADPRREIEVSRMDGGCKEQMLADYETAILHNAQAEREQYLVYLRKQGIVPGAGQGLIDFVASGTVQYHLEKLLGCSLQGLYFATMNLPNGMYQLGTGQIAAAYGNLTSYGTQGSIGKHYLFLESILGDGKASFSHIDREGNEVFEETEGVSSREAVEQLQKAAQAYTAEYTSLFAGIKAGVPELEFVDKLFGMLFTGRCLVERQVKEAFQNEDLYDGVDAYQPWEEF